MHRLTSHNAYGYKFTKYNILFQSISVTRPTFFNLGLIHLTDFGWYMVPSTSHRGSIYGKGRHTMSHFCASPNACTDQLPYDKCMCIMSVYSLTSEYPETTDTLIIKRCKSQYSYNWSNERINKKSCVSLTKMFEEIKWLSEYMLPHFLFPCPKSAVG